jgi:uncharacterized membrane protein YkoI
MRSVCLGLAVLVFGPGASSALAQAAQPQTGFAVSLQKAMQRFPGAILVRGSYEFAGASQSGSGVWGFYLWRNGMHEIEITNPAGTIVIQRTLTDKQTAKKVDPTVLAAVKSQARAKLTMAQFIEIAQDAANGGQVTGVQLVLSNGQLVAQLTVGGGNTVNIDMTTGKVQQQQK